MKYQIFFILFLSIQLHGEGIFWQYLESPNIGLINKIEINNRDDIFITSYNGVFSSNDNGISWEHVILYDYIDDLAISSNNVIFLHSWPEHVGYPQLYVHFDIDNKWDSVYIDASGKSIGFDGNDTYYFSKKSKFDTLTIFLSSDYGKSWDTNYLIHNLKDKFVNWKNSIDSRGKIVIGGIDYTKSIGNPDGIIFISYDKGKSWQRIENIPPVRCWLFFNDNDFIVGTGEGLYYTTDSGKTWSFQFPDTYINNLHQLNDKEIIMSAGNDFYYSTDRGKSWERMSSIWFNTNTLNSNSDGSILYGGNYLGFYYSTNKGKDWFQSNKGFTAADIFDITFDKEGNVYAAGNGIYKSADYGISWEYVGLDDENIDKIIIDEKGYIFVYAEGLGGVLRSTDGGKTWDHKLYDIYGPCIVSDFFINKRGHLFAHQFRTTDNGETWTNEYKDTMSGYYSFAMNSEGHIFRGGYREIYRSTDDGDTWELIYTLPYSIDGCRQVMPMLFHTKYPVGYACNYKTTDNGRTWYEADWEREPVYYPFAIDPAGHIYSFGSSFIIPPYYKYLYRTVKDSTWERIDTGLYHSDFRTVAVSPKGYIFLSAKNGGMYRSSWPITSVENTQHPAPSTQTHNFPNPFSDETEIIYTLEKAANVRLIIYDVLGNKVLEQDLGMQSQGQKSFQFKIQKQDSYGMTKVLFYRISAGSDVMTGKMILIENKQ